jgi:hypothetical protein
LARGSQPRHFGNHGATALGDFIAKGDIFGRIRLVETTGQHRYCAGGDRTLMGGGVDAVPSPETMA